MDNSVSLGVIASDTIEYHAIKEEQEAHEEIQNYINEQKGKAAAAAIYPFMKF